MVDGYHFISVDTETDDENRSTNIDLLYCTVSSSMITIDRSLPLGSKNVVQKRVELVTRCPLNGQPNEKLMDGQLTSKKVAARGMDVDREATSKLIFTRTYLADGPLWYGWKNRNSAVFSW